MNGWTGFLALAPERVREVIENGPMPYAEYGGSKLTAKDKRMGMMSFKGGEGRGGLSMKASKQAVVYYDPSFAKPEYTPDDIPDSVLERHSYEEYVAEFKKL